MARFHWLKMFIGVILLSTVTIISGSTFNQDFEEEIFKDGKEMDSSNLNDETSQLETLFSFMDHSVDFPKLDEAVLILGNGGSEKSAIAKILGADNSLLEAIKTEGTFSVNDKRPEDDIYNLVPFMNGISLEFLNNTDENNDIGPIYDCAEFSYENEISINIAASYFNAKIMESTHKVKLLFTINQSSFKPKVKYDDLKQLLQQMQKFIHVIDKFKHSIAIIVEAESGVNSNEIIEFFKQLDKNLGKELTKTTKKEKQNELKRMQQLLKSLLEQETITLYVRPSKIGDISKDKDVQNNRGNLYKFIESLEFAEVGEDDFGYTLSQNSQNEIKDRMSEAIEKFGLQINNLFGDWLINLQLEIQNEPDPETISVLYSQNLAILKKLKSSLSKPKDDSDILKILQEYNTKLKYTIQVSTLDNLERRQGFLNLYTALSNTKPKLDVSHWMQSIEDLIDFVTKYKEWYGFTWAAYEHLSSSNVQLNLEKFRERYKLVDNFSLSDFSTFYNKLEKDVKAFSSFDRITESELTENQKLDIRYILNETITDNSEDFDCSKEIWSVTGNSFSLNIIEKPQKICLGKNLDKTRIINLFATNTIYINGSIEFKTETAYGSKIIIMAPVVQVSNGVIIHFIAKERNEPASFLMFTKNADNIEALKVRISHNKYRGFVGVFDGKNAKVERDTPWYACDKIDVKENEYPGFHCEACLNRFKAQGWTHKGSVRFCTSPKPPPPPPPPPVSYVGIPNPLDHVLNYKYNVFKKLNPFNRKSILEFFEYLNDGEQVSKLWNTADFGQEFSNLIKIRFDDSINYSKMNEILSDSFFSLKRRINDYAKILSYDSVNNRCFCSNETCDSIDECKTLSNVIGVPHSENTAPHKKTLGIIYIALLGQITALEGTKDNVLVIDIEEYLKTLSKAVDKNSENLNNNKLQELVKKYKQNIDSKIEEAGDLIQDVFQQEISMVSELTTTAINKMLDKILILERNAKSKIEEVTQMRNHIQSSMNTKLAGGVLGLVGKLFGVIGAKPVSDFFNGLGSLTTSAGSAMHPDQTENLNAAKTVIHDQASKFVDYFNDLNSRNDIELSNHILKIQNSMKKLPPKYDSAIKEVNAGVELWNEYKQSRVKDPGARTKALSAIIPAAKKLMTVKGDKGKDEKKITGIIQYYTTVMGFLEQGFNIYKEWNEGSKKIEIANGLIGQLGENLKMFNDLRNKINVAFMPIVKDLTFMLEDWADGENKNQSLASLDISKYQFSNSLKDIRMELKNVAVLLQSDSENILNLFNKLDNILQSTTSIYEKMEKYREHQEFVDLQAGIESAKTNEIEVKDPKLNRIITENKLLIQYYTNMFYYQSAMTSFRQYVFPFALYYEEDFAKAKQFYDDDDQSAMIRLVKDNIDGLINKLELEASSIREGKDDRMIHEEFENGRETIPFYIWNSDQFQFEIKSLLEGKKVSFYSHIFQSHSKFDAIKFRRVMLKFELAEGDESLAKEFQKDLNDFSLNMTHTGNSYYRYKGKYYVIASPTVTIERSFEMKGDKPRSTSGAYNKLNSGDFTLSPYTVWVFQLYTNKGKFDSLKKYNDLKIDLHLEGSGMYVKSESIDRDLQLEKFYAEDETLLKLSQTIDSKIESKGRSVTNGTKIKRKSKLFSLIKKNGHYVVKFGKQNTIPKF